MRTTLLLILVFAFSFACAPASTLAAAPQPATAPAKVPANDDGEYTHEQAAVEMLDVIQEWVGILAKVQDQDTASKASEDMTALAEKVTEIGKRRKKLPEPSDKEDDRLMKKYQPRLDKLEKSMQTEMARIQNLDPALLVTLLDGVMKVAKAFEESMPPWMN